MEEYEVGDIVEMSFCFIDKNTRITLNPGTPILLIEGPIKSKTRKIMWEALTPGGILIKVPQEYFLYDTIVEKKR
jgi:hypothetical protein